MPSPHALFHQPPGARPPLGYDISRLGRARRSRSPDRSLALSLPQGVALIQQCAPQPPVFPASAGSCSLARSVGEAVTSSGSDHTQELVSLAQAALAAPDGSIQRRMAVWRLEKSLRSISGKLPLEIHAVMGVRPPVGRTEAGPSPRQEIELLERLKAGGMPQSSLLHFVDHVAASRARAAVGPGSGPTFASHQRMIQWACSLFDEPPPRKRASDQESHQLSQCSVHSAWMACGLARPAHPKRLALGRRFGHLPAAHQGGSPEGSSAPAAQKAPQEAAAAKSPPGGCLARLFRDGLRSSAGLRVWAPSPFGAIVTSIMCDISRKC